MLPEAKQEWITALRSGEYLQTRGQLCDGNGRMCCLGVLVDVTQDGLWIELPNIYGSIGNGWQYKNRSGSLVPSVLKSVGLSEDEENLLVGLNDEEELTFEQIAAWAELNL